MPDNINRQTAQKTVFKSSVNINPDKAGIVENIPDTVIGATLNRRRSLLIARPCFGQGGSGFSDTRLHRQF
jgi:hypothetical protein